MTDAGTAAARITSCLSRATQQIMFPGMIALPYCRVHAAGAAAESGRPLEPVEWTYIEEGP